MKLLQVLSVVAPLLPFSASTIIDNGHYRETRFLNTKVASVTANSTTWKTYGPNATEISYKGRWDSQHVSWWAAPGLKFAFTGQNLALSFGPLTTDSVLVAYRIGSLAWQMTNISSSATHHLISPSTPGMNLTGPSTTPLPFELRVTNWAYGIQLSAVHVAPNAKLVKIPSYPRKIEFIGDSLTSGYGASYEALSGFGFAAAAGLGNVEYDITAYPGICLADANCWGNPRGQTYQWFRVSDTSPRAAAQYGTNPPKWDFRAHQPADLVVINIGTNDHHPSNPVKPAQYVAALTEFLPAVHRTYPGAEVVVMGLWGSWAQNGTRYVQNPYFVEEILGVYRKFKGEGWLHYFNTTGVLQRNDISPVSHPNDVGHIKVASHLMRFINEQFGWELGATGGEVLHETAYWNDQVNY